jgi:hypothetical protein
MFSGGAGTPDPLGGGVVGTVTVALAVAVAPEALRAVMVNVVVALICTVVLPLTGTDVPLIEALVALVVCQLTAAVLEPWSEAWMVAVGAPEGGGVFGTVTVALAVAVAPVALRAVMVKVVVPVMLTVCVPLTATVTPLIVADAALVVCHVTRALVLFTSEAWMVAVGGGVEVEPTVARASPDDGPYW